MTRLFKATWAVDRYTMGYSWWGYGPLPCHSRHHRRPSGHRDHNDGVGFRGVA